jgi:hypothetical protein
MFNNLLSSILSTIGYEICNYVFNKNDYKFNIIDFGVITIGTFISFLIYDYFKKQPIKPLNIVDTSNDEK